MKKVGTRLCAAVLCLALILALGGCNDGVYRNDDKKKSYDPNYTPAARDPLALTEEQEEEIKNAAITIWNANATAEYEAALKNYNDQLSNEASKIVAMSNAAASDEKINESNAKIAESKAKLESRKASSSSKTGSDKSSSAKMSSIDFGSNTYASVYESPEFVKPEVPAFKDVGDVSIYNYGGTYNGYIAVRYKLKGSAVISAHKAENLESDVISTYDFSYYPDSPAMAMYKEGAFYSIREIYESGQISEQNLKDIWYYFYVED